MIYIFKIQRRTILLKLHGFHSVQGKKGSYLLCISPCSKYLNGSFKIIGKYKDFHSTPKAK